MERSHHPFSVSRVEADGEWWTLFCPNEASGLAEVWGEEFEELHERYENEGRGRKTIKAQKLWYAILEAQIETGTPFMLNKDAANREFSFCRDVHLSHPLPTSRTLVPSSHPSFALRSSSTRLRMRPLSAT